MTLTARERLTLTNAALSTLPALGDCPAQFAALDVAGLRDMYVRTHADPVAAAGALQHETDPVRVLALVAPHAIPRAQQAHDAHVAARAAQEARRRSEERVAEAGRDVARALATGRHVAPSEATDVVRETDDDGRVVPRSLPAVSNGVPQAGASVQLASGERATVLYVVSGAVIARTDDGRVVSL